MYMLGLPWGLDAPWLWTTTACKQIPKYCNVCVFVYKLSAGETKQYNLSLGRLQFNPFITSWRIAPGSFSYLKKSLWVKGWTSVCNRWISSSSIVLKKHSSEGDSIWGHTVIHRSLSFPLKATFPHNRFILERSIKAKELFCILTYYSSVIWRCKKKFKNM